MRGARVLVVLLAGIACSGEPGVPDAGDAGHDAGSDSGRDAGLDGAQFDAPVDGALESASDALGDVGDAPTCDPQWTRVAGFPDNCYMMVAHHPECAYSLRWDPCPPELPTCTMSVITPNDVVGISGPLAHWDHDRGRGIFVTGSATATEGGSVIFSTEGGALAAVHEIGDNPAVGVCPADLSASNDGVAAAAEDEYTRGSPRPVALFRGSYADYYNHPLPVGELASLPVGADPQDFLTSSTVTVNQIVPAGYLLISRSGAPVRHSRPGSATPRTVIGDHVFWQTDGEVGITTRIFHTGASDVDELLIDGAATGEPIAWFDTDGTTMAWTPVIIGPDGHTAIGFHVMVAPFATNAAGVVARRVPADLPATASDPRLGPGVIAYDITGPPPNYADYVEVMQLSDGSRTRVTLPDVPLWRATDAPTWVTDTEVGIPAHTRGGPLTLLRIPRSAFVRVP